MRGVRETGKQKYPLLQQIEFPKDLKAMKQKQMIPLADEIRSYLVENVSKTGGHLSSNLGIVEITLAIHRVFSSPCDHIIFDVGHQAYVHKLLTGRKDRFDTLRQSGGISGFPKREESNYDAFGTGHASTSLSAALGFAQADKLNGSNAYTVCVLGDGAYTGGMIHEAMNNCREDLHLVIILNENEMSISKNIGHFATYLAKIRASKGYLRAKSAVKKTLTAVPLFGKLLLPKIKDYKQDVKTALYGSDVFENFGLHYLGPIDGNNEYAVEKMLEEAKQLGKSCILHVKTKKGKGYTPAEKNPGLYHGMSPSGVVCDPENHFSHLMGRKLSALAKKNPKVCAITAAMADGTGLSDFAKEFPERFFDVGIAEEHAVTFAAGLAANGYRPFVAVYSTFLQRAYDNIIHDVALQKLPVVFLIDRAGINCSDGPTHAGVFDVAFLSQIPNLRIFTPLTKEALEKAMEASLAMDLPCAIRYPNASVCEEIKERFYQNPEIEPWIRADARSAESPDTVIVTDGRIVREAFLAKDLLEKEGRAVEILLLEEISPYETVAKRILSMVPSSTKRLVFLEEEIERGGMGLLLSEEISKMQNGELTLAYFGLKDPFQTCEAGKTCYETAELDGKSIAEKILNLP